MFSMRVIRSRIEKKILGLTFVELAIVLTIVGLVLGAIWVAAANVYSSKNANAGAQTLNVIVQNMRTFYAQQNGVVDSGGNALTQALDQFKIFPLDTRQDTSTPAGIIFNPWNAKVTSGQGSIFIDADNCSGTAKTDGSTQACFDVTYTGVPHAACVQLAEQTTQKGMGLQQINVNGVQTGILNGATAQTGLPVLASVAQTKCNETGLNGADTILWIYSVRVNNS